MRTITLIALLCCLPAVSAAAQSHLLIISGLAGEPQIEEQFHNWSSQMITAATERMGVPPDQVTYLAENPAREPGMIAGRSTREAVDAELQRLAQRAGPNDRILILLIGHGSSDSRSSRINLPGPDLTAPELGAMLDRFPTQQVVVVNTTSASGAFQEPLAGEGRTIITATRTGQEQNQTLFAGFFVDAFAQDVADTDKDGRVTILEAFDYAVTELERHYQGQNQIQTEHPVLGGDRELARTFYLGGAAAAPAIAADSPQLRALLEQRRSLESQIETLRGKKDEMEEDAYEAELERLLLDLARTTREIREMEGT